MKKYFVVLIIILISGIFVFSDVKKVEAENVYGGFVTNSIFCNCSGNFLVNITPPKGGQFIYQPGSQAYLNFNLPGPGIWALGLYSPGGICLMYSGDSCKPFGAPIGTIRPTSGTSL